jgi:small conductance mechanosensitive channel
MIALGRSRDVGARGPWGRWARLRRRARGTSGDVYIPLDLAGDAVERSTEVAGRLAVAAVTFLVLAATALLIRPAVRALLERRRRPSFTRVFLGLYRVVALLVCFLLAMTIAFPSVEMVDLLTSLGILSVAAGFAFRDVLENLLAGALLLLRDPFKAGDEVRTGRYEGRVEGVTARETILRTFDGRRVLVPNAQIAAEPLEVLTHHATARSSFTIPVAPDADADAVRAATIAALSSVPEVLADPAPEAVFAEVDADALVLECRYWTTADRRTSTRACDEAIAGVLEAFREAGIPQPIDQLTIRRA